MFLLILVKAIEGILSVSMRTPVGTKTEAIRLQDMISMLRIPKSVTTVEEGSWVRVKRGVYSADLGQVHRVDESKGKVWIKLIPRIDLNKLDPGEKRKRKARAAAVHFNAEEMMYVLHQPFRESFNKLSGTADFTWNLPEIII